MANCQWRYPSADSSSCPRKASMPSMREGVQTFLVAERVAIQYRDLIVGIEKKGAPARQCYYRAPAPAPDTYNKFWSRVLRGPLKNYRKMNVRQIAQRFGNVVKQADTYGRAANWLIRNAPTAVRGVKRAIGSSGRQYPNKRQAIDRVTTQKDYAAISTKRNRKRLRKAKKWKRYVKRVNKAVASYGPSRKIVKTFNSSVTVDAAGLAAAREGAITWGRVGRQSVINLPMFQFTKNNASQDGDDINEMLALLTGNEANTSDQAVTIPIFIKSGMWEFIMTNFDTNAVYVDVYHYTVKRTGIYDFNDLIPASDAQVAAGNVPAGGTNYITTPGIFDYGWTPYQSRVLMQYINIFKKERYLMSSGQSVQIERRMRINKMWRKEQSANGLSDVENKLCKGISQGVIIIAYGAPQNLANARITGTHNVNVSVNKSLFFQRGSAQAQNADVENRTYN